MLSALPSPNDLEEFLFKFTLYETSLDKSLSKLGLFESPNCLYRFLEAVRWVNGLRELEASGIVELVIFDIEKHIACHSILEDCYSFYHKIK